MARGMLEASVAAGEAGPVGMLAGEPDLTCAGQLGALITGRLSVGTRHLTTNVPGLPFADSASIRALPLAARMLALIGADPVITIRDISTATP